MPTEADLRIYYATKYAESHHQLSIQESSREYYISHVAELENWWGRYTRPALVDFGSSYPVLAIEAMRAGFGRAIAVDYGVEGADFAVTESRIELMTPEAFFDEVQDNSVDILRFSHVLEHTVDPVHVLAAALKKVRSKGLIYVTQPSIPVLRPRVSPVDVQDSDYPYHLHFFSPTSLLQMTRALGIETQCFFTHTAEAEQFERHAAQIDAKFAKERLRWARNRGDQFFGRLSNYPIYSGRNSTFRGIKP